MERRGFIQAGMAAGLALVQPAAWPRGGPSRGPAPPRTFRLRYAPHFGMFKNSAGDDLVAQIDFMADQGFAALEDNDMRRRPVAEQERIAQAMTRRGVAMGVFVAHTIAWNATGLPGGQHLSPYLREGVQGHPRDGARQLHPGARGRAGGDRRLRGRGCGDQRLSGTPAPTWMPQLPV